MTAMTQDLTISGMIDELLAHGTITGCTSLDEMRQAGEGHCGIGAEYQVQRLAIDSDGRLRQLSGIALSENLTIARLYDKFHKELVGELIAELRKREESDLIIGQGSPLFAELVHS